MDVRRSVRRAAAVFFSKKEAARAVMALGQVDVPEAVNAVGARGRLPPVRRVDRLRKAAAMDQFLASEYGGCVWRIAPHARVGGANLT